MKGFWYKPSSGQSFHVLGDPALADDPEFRLAIEEMALAAQKTSEQALWCPFCQAFYGRNQLKLWSNGGDSYHHLCPGCDNDLLPAQTEDEYFGLDEEGEE